MALLLFKYMPQTDLSAWYAMNPTANIGSILSKTINLHQTIHVFQKDTRAAHTTNHFQHHLYISLEKSNINCNAFK